MSDLHEAKEDLQPAIIDQHRAYRSLIEELEAIDWYAQRIDATDDAELKAILIHNRDEEKEHASMVLEWLRRRDPVLHTYLKTYLFTEGPIDAIEEQSESEEQTNDGQGNSSSHMGLGIGAIREGNK